MSSTEDDDETKIVGERCLSLHAMQALYELQQNNELCDATIVLDDGMQFHIHRAIMCACSSYFKAMFLTTLNGKSKQEVSLPGITADMMKILINYAYLRKLDVNSDNVYQIVAIADYLSILGILDICCEYLQKTITVRNCIGLLLFARAQFLPALREACWNFIMRNFSRVASESLELVTLQEEELSRIINDDELNVKSEEIVWGAILKWINHDPENRKKSIVSLMKCIRLGLLDTQFFLEHVKDHPYVTSSDDSRPMIIETLKFLYDLETISHRDGEVPTPEIARPRVPHEVLFAIGGWSGGSPTNYLETYDTRADRWVKVEETDPNGPRAYHGTAVVGYEVFVIGGFDGMDYFNSCRCFNAVQKSWSEIAPMHAKRCYVSTTVVNDIVYAMGGYDGQHRQNSAEKYDPKINQWTFISPMNMQRSDASACTLNGQIYITGGFNGQECMHSAEVYDVDANQWTLINPMRSRRSGVSCIAYHGYVYVVGGFNGISRMCSGEKYNPTTNTWTQIPDMYNPRSNFAIEVIDDMIFVIGGFNGVTTIYHVECYDDRTNEWYEATDMNIYRSALSACVIQGLPNVRDYIHKHREKLMEEKRQRMIALEAQRDAANNNTTNANHDVLQVQQAHAQHAHNLQQLNVLQQLANVQANNGNVNNNNNNNNNNNTNNPPVPMDVEEADDVEDNR